MPYPTQDDISLALKHNYKVTICPKKGTSFEREKRHIWNIKDGWQTATLIGGYYRDHHVFTELSDALKHY